MTSSPWRRAVEIFQDLVMEEPGHRRELLEEACGRDASLREAVESLLAADAEADTFLEKPLVERPTAALAAPTRLGPYRLDRVIGEGGMGRVYLAIRDDDVFKRRVAIKLVRLDLASSSVARRLRVERQILASLDHPNIAQIFDGGTTEAGQPYFVMEYVEGSAIDDYCDQNRLSIDDRLTLFRKVCSAVHYAHQNLVVHRDLKPSNILVTAEGEPKLLDFGIAKLLNPELGAPNLDPTQPWVRLLTPRYASPEQLAGKPITTVSDVYSLGVLLYRLLTGHLPHRFETQSPREIERILSEEVPDKPSVTVMKSPSTSGGATTETLARARDTRPPDLRRELNGDLDSIVLKALRSAPALRYSSAEQLADDLERRQSGLPVLARQGTWQYRGGKFLRRHRGGVLVAALVASLLVGFAVAMARQSARVARERDAAQVERDKARSVLTLMLDIFRVSDPFADNPAETFTVREALDQAEPLLERRLRDQPLVRSEILQATGTIYHHLGLYDRAQAMLDQSVMLRRAELPIGHSDTGDSLRALGNTLKERGEFGESEVVLREAVTIARDHAAQNPVKLVDTLNDLTSLYCYERAYTQARPLAEEALARARSLSAGEPSDSLLVAVTMMATVSYSQGDYAQAVDRYEEAVSLSRELSGKDHPNEALVLLNLGLARRRLNDFAGAMAAYQKALAIQFKTLGADHPLLAATYSNLGGAQRALASYAEAEASYRRARDLKIASAGADHWRVAFYTVRIANIQIEQGAAAEAERTLRALLPEWRERFGDHWVIPFAEGVLGEALTAQGRLVEGENLLVGSFQALLQEPQQRRRQEAFDRLQALYSAAGTPEKLVQYRQLLDTKRSSP